MWVLSPNIKSKIAKLVDKDGPSSLAKIGKEKRLNNGPLSSESNNAQQNCRKCPWYNALAFNGEIKYKYLNLIWGIGK